MDWPVCARFVASSFSAHIHEVIHEIYTWKYICNHGQQYAVGGLDDGDQGKPNQGGSDTLSGSDDRDQGIGVASKQKDYVNNSMKSCHIIDAKVTYEDFEMGIYKAHSDNFDWRMVFRN